MTVQTNDYDFMRSDFVLNVPIFLGNISYPTVEHAFQALKTSDPDVRREIAGLSLQEARRKGRSVDLRDNWEQAKYLTMQSLVESKFFQDADLAQSLVDTGDEDIEMIHQSDEYWGCREEYGTMIGQNSLGKILMSVRRRLVATLGIEPTAPEEDDSDEEPELLHFIKKIIPEQELSSDLDSLFSAAEDVLSEAEDLWAGEVVNLEDFKVAVDKLGEVLADAKQEIKDTADS